MQSSSTSLAPSSEDDNKKALQDILKVVHGMLSRPEAGAYANN